MTPEITVQAHTVPEDARMPQNRRTVRPGRTAIGRLIVRIWAGFRGFVGHRMQAAETAARLAEAESDAREAVNRLNDVERLLTEARRDCRMVRSDNEQLQSTVKIHESEIQLLVAVIERNQKRVEAETATAVRKALANPARIP